jgi:hypothetical protein
MCMTTNKQTALVESSNPVGYFCRRRHSLLACDVICLILLLILFGVGIANTTFEEKCINEYREVRNRFGYRDEEVLIRTCREDLERCGADACLCENVYNPYSGEYNNGVTGYNNYNGFADNGDFDEPDNNGTTTGEGYCDSSYRSTAFVPTGGWGAMLFVVTANLFFCVCCCGSCGLAYLFIRDKRAYDHLQQEPPQNRVHTAPADKTETDNTGGRDDFVSNFP